MIQIISAACPECQQAHATAKQAQTCLIAAINRWLISQPCGEQHAAAHLQYFVTLLYYKQRLLGDNLLDEQAPALPQANQQLTGQHA